MGLGEQTTAVGREINDRSGALSWIVHPAHAKPLRALLVVSLLAVVVVLVYFLLASPFWAVFAAALLLVSLRQFFLPTTFRLTDEAVVSRFLWFEKRKEWDYFRSYSRDRNGVLLSPFSGPSRLESFRGFYLIGAGRQPGVLDFIREKLKR